MVPTAATDNGEGAVLRRALLLRAAGRAAAALSARGASAARVCVLAARDDGSPRALWRELPSGHKALELRAGPGLLRSAGAAQEEAVAAALDGAVEGRPYPRPPRAAPAEVLLFRSLLECPGKEGADRINQGTFFLASALRAAGVGVVLADVKISRFRADPSARAELADVVARHPGIGLAALSLYDDFFDDARALARFIRERSRARLAVGALMPTRSPSATFAHFPEADMLGRGAGEELLPRLAAASAASAPGPWTDAARGALLELDGTLAADGESVVWGAAERVNRIGDLDRSRLDFALLEKRDAESGPTFCLSRGCGSSCFFCTSPDQGRFSGKTPDEVGRVLAAYGRRLRGLYGSWSAVPPAAFGLGFYDDDFLADGARALSVLALVKASPFHLRFVQTGIRSFFRGAGRRGTAPDSRLIAALDPALFAPKVHRREPPGDRHLYLGTESFCDAELARLGKGYDAAQVEAVVRALSARGLRQAHHLIASNARTTPVDVVEGLACIARLSAECGPSFGVLEPAISHLKSFPGTPSWRSLEKEGLLRCVRLRGELRAEGFPEFDYPLVDHDEPLDPDVALWARRLSAKAPGTSWSAELAGLRREWLERAFVLEASEPERASRLRRAGRRA
jgi:radical SAM superfamily enzyme YgiQ (UPF0313 family)